MLWSILIVVVLLAAACYVVVVIRRSLREHRARSEERAAAMLLALNGRPAPSRVEPSTLGPAKVATASAGVAHVPASEPAPLSALSALRRPRLLTDPQRLLYLVLRAALPEHIIMANTRMLDLFDLPPGAEAIEHDQRLRAMLHQRLDCVVCRNDLVPLAALVVYAAGVPRAYDEQSMAETLRELGVSFLRFRVDSLPRPAEMRTLILG